MKVVAIALAVSAALSACSSDDPMAPPPIPSLSILYSERSVETEALVGVYRGGVPNGARSPLRTQPFDGAFTASPDGSFVVRRTPYSLGGDRSELAVASSSDLESFRTIVRVRGSYIEHVLWSPDATTIYFLQSPQSGAGGYELRSVGRDGSNARSIRRFETDEHVTLAAVDPHREVIFLTSEFFSDDAGEPNRPTRITAIDLSTGNIDPLDVNIPPILGPDLTFAPEGTAAYYFNGSTVIEHTLATAAERVLHRSNNREASVHSIFASPAGKAIYFAEDDAKDIAQTTLFQVTLADLSSKVVHRYRGSVEGGPRSLSPDGAWMWFDVQHQLLDLRNDKLHPFGGVSNDEIRFEFLAWVSA